MLILAQRPHDQSKERDVCGNRQGAGDPINGGAGGQVRQSGAETPAAATRRERRTANPRRGPLGRSLLHAATPFKYPPEERAGRGRPPAVPVCVHADEPGPSGAELLKTGLKQRPPLRATSTPQRETRHMVKERPSDADDEEGRRDGVTGFSALESRENDSGEDDTPPRDATRGPQAAASARLRLGAEIWLLFHFFYFPIGA